jgi:epoxyqueuosine reductase
VDAPAPLDILDILESSLRSAGLSEFGFLSGDRLRAAAAGLDARARSRYGVDGARGVVAAALGYGEGPGGEPGWAGAWPGPRARIGRFARANWYAELLSRLQRAAAGFRAGLRARGIDPGPSRAYRRFVNSSLPEKRLAYEAGLGELGRHCLLMLPGRGSAVVLGLLFLPLDLPDSLPEPRERRLGPGCADCRACLAACPTGALRGDGTMERELCLQHWSSLEGELPAAVEAAWGDLLYGCDLCQEACPRYRPDPAADTVLGRLGPGLPASWLEASDEGELARTLEGSALGMAWISPAALKRNARHLTRPGAPPTMKKNGGLNGNL